MPESYRYPSKIKRHLEPAHRELVERGFLTEATHEKRGKSNLVHYKISERFVRERAQRAPELTDEERLAVDSLVAGGVWTSAAGRLVKAHGPDRCLRYVEALAYQEDVKNPGAWLTKFIENGWPVQVLDAPLRSGIPSSSRNTERGEAPMEKDDEPAEDYQPGPVSNAQDASPRATFVEGGQGSPDWDEVVARRRVNGEFDAAVCAFETLPYEEYRKFVGTPRPIVFGDNNGDRYYVSLDSDLYVYLGGQDAEHRRYVKTLDRPGEFRG